jgi:hypothetical protein
MSDHLFDERRASSGHAVEDYVAVMFAESRVEAEMCRSVLSDNGIPARVETALERHKRSVGIPVLIPSDRLDEASGLLAASKLTAPFFAADHVELEDAPRDDDEDLDDFDDDEDDDFDDDDDDDDDDLLDDDDDDDDDDEGAADDEEA